MLAKQGWRILTKANSLVSKIMKTRYFYNTVFLNAEFGANPSYIWRSILSTQDVLKVGCMRRIGNGASTKVWKVPWLPCKENGCVSTSLVLKLYSIDVQNLIYIGTGTWDNDVLNDLFNVHRLQLIWKVPIPLRQRCDSWFWMLEAKGQFTVRSMYKQLQGSYDMMFRSFWYQLWSLKISSKVVCFM